MILTTEIWNRALQGYLIYDCCVRNKNRQAYLLVKDTGSDDIDYYPATRFLFTYNDESDPEESYYYIESEEYDVSKITYNEIGNETIAVDLGGLVYSHSAGEDRDERNHPNNLKDSNLAAIISNVKTIGQSIYTVGKPRRVHKRLGVNQWRDLTEHLPLPDIFAKGETSLEYGWSDLAGFSETDMYAVGGFGDVWHYDGEKFHQCDFPSNEWLHNVCCSDDGNVYVGGNLGRLWVGKKNSWKLISPQEFVMPWKNIAWFANRLFLGSDYGLWELIDGKVVMANVPSQVKMCCGSISVSSDKTLLLTAGQNGASLFDGKDWEVLFDALELNDAYMK